MRRPRQGHPCQPGRLVQVQVRRCCSKRRRVGRRQVTVTLLPEAPERRHPFGPRQGALNWSVRSRRSRLFRRGRAQAHQSTPAAGSAPRPGSCLSRGKAAARSTARWWQADQARQLRISRSRQARNSCSERIMLSNAWAFSLRSLSFCLNSQTLRWASIVVRLKGVAVIGHSPGRLSLPHFFTSLVPISAKLFRALEISNFLNPIALANSSRRAPFVMTF